MYGLVMQVLEDEVLNQGYEVTYSSLLCTPKLANFIFFYFFTFYFLFFIFNFLIFLFFIVFIYFLFLLLFQKRKGFPIIK